MNSLLLILLTPFAIFILLVALLALSSILRLSTAGFAARVLISFACLTLCACYGVVASIVLRCVGYGGLSQWTTARAFKYVMKWAAGVEFVVQGREHLESRPCVIIGNHQTYVIVVLCGFGAKMDLEDEACGGVEVERESGG